ncbi:S1C family serine protease [Streptomyces avicenniae]|uniref:S1C family serine protease n=1 Tax=Streptomyces avicenniae TaxID=500153 RepID=UPI00069A5AFF|nr:trypsin-like peptidase domain-containing protein [Streptomyces avicenniae]
MSTENERSGQPDGPTAGAPETGSGPAAPAAQPPAQPPAGAPSPYAPPPQQPTPSYGTPPAHPVPPSPYQSAPPPHAQPPQQGPSPYQPQPQPQPPHQAQPPQSPYQSAPPPQAQPPHAPAAPAGPPADQPSGPATTVLRALPPSPPVGQVPGQGGVGPLPPAEPWTALPPPPPKKKRNGLLIGILVAAVVAGCVGGGVGYLVADDDASPAASAPGRGDGDDVVARPPDSVAGIAESALPSVVTIEAGNGAEAGTGTGFVYDEEGHIMTNNHVVAPAADGGTLSVTFSDGESYDAEVVGRAEGYDVAVIRLTDLDGRELAPLPLGDSDGMAVGDATIAIGAPFGLSGTVTTGIISAKDRPVASSDGQGASASYMNALQTDASINPGNSGGPLLNANGEVIGVNSAIRSTSNGMGEAGSIGLGFAIPINQAARVAQDLIEGGEPIYPIIGASVDNGASGAQTAGAPIVEQTNDGSEAVVGGGPADEAGLRPGDVIIRFGDRPIDSGPTLISQIWTYEPGDSVEITYTRDGEENTTTLTLGQRVGD